MARDAGDLFSLDSWLMTGQDLLSYAGPSSIHEAWPWSRAQVGPIASLTSWVMSLALAVFP